MMDKFQGFDCAAAAAAIDQHMRQREIGLRALRQSSAIPLDRFTFCDQRVVLNIERGEIKLRVRIATLCE